MQQLVEHVPLIFGDDVATDPRQRHRRAVGGEAFDANMPTTALPMRDAGEIVVDVGFIDDRAEQIGIGRSAAAATAIIAKRRGVACPVRPAPSRPGAAGRAQGRIIGPSRSGRTKSMRNPFRPVGAVPALLYVQCPEGSEFSREISPPAGSAGTGSAGSNGGPTPARFAPSAHVPTRVHGRRWSQGRHIAAASQA